MGTADAYDRVMSALAVWREARGESMQAKLAVAYVIRNRMKDGRWPQRASGVVLQPRQFSSFNIGDPNATKFPGASEPAWLECCMAVDMSIDGELKDPSGGATNYESVADPGARPKWADPERVSAKLGPFRFYRL